MKLTILVLLSFLFLTFSFKTCAQKKEGLSTKEKKSTKSANVSILRKEFIIDALNDISRKTLNELYHKTGKSFIVVGVENGGEKRIEEYTPWEHEKYGGGKGDIYINFLANELKPFIDKNYRTESEANQTAIIGSSLGGLISFYGGFKYPEVFGKVGALSTSFWFSDKIKEFAKENGKQTNTKLFLLVGEKEGDAMVPDTQNMEKLLLETGFPKKNIKTKIVAEGKHTESFWKAEFLEVITFLYNL